MASARLVSGALVACLLLVWSAPPAAAEPVKANPSKAPLSASVAARVASLKPAPRAFQTATGTSAGSDRPFVRSPLGVVAIIVMGAGLAYAVKTAFKDNDPVHSPIR